MSEQNQKVREGIVLSNKMQKTVVVAVERRALNKTFKKYVKAVTKFKVHDEKNEAKVGDHVQIIEGKPISREKRWRLQKILRKKETAENIQL